MVEKLWLRKCFYPYLNSIIIIKYNNAVSYRYNLYCKHFMKCNLKSQLWFQLQHQRVEIKSNVVNKMANTLSSKFRRGIMKRFSPHERFWTGLCYHWPR